MQPAGIINAVVQPSAAAIPSAEAKHEHVMDMDQPLDNHTNEVFNASIDIFERILDEKATEKLHVLVYTLTQDKVQPRSVRWIQLTFHSLIHHIISQMCTQAIMQSQCAVGIHVLTSTTIPHNGVDAAATSASTCWFVPQWT